MNEGMSWLPNGEEPTLGDLLYIEDCEDRDSDEGLFAVRTKTIYLVVALFSPHGWQTGNRLPYCLWFEGSDNPESLAEMESVFRNFPREHFRRKEESEHDYEWRLSDAASEIAKKWPAIEFGTVWNWKIKGDEVGFYKGKASCFLMSRVLTLPKLPEL